MAGSELRLKGKCNNPKGSDPVEVSMKTASEEETLNICRMTQSMIDLAAKQLFGLRRCRTSEELIQKEICECEVRKNIYRISL